jgi:hypothetical protein
LEFDVESVEVGDKFVVTDDDLENGNPFYFIFYNKPLHRCEQAFDDD